MELLDIGYDDSRFTTVVHEDLHCAICLNVLKEPMQCRSNEHHFCTACIKRHLENFQTCPSCMEELTLATLKKPSRFLATNLSDLVIRCDYVDRGCPEVVVLTDLKTHLINCEFSPVQCSNEGCTKVINKRERIFHESQICQFRKLRCDDCRETRKDIDEVKLRLEELQDQMSQMITGMNCLTQAVKTLSPQKALTVKEDIIVVGGRNHERRLNSAEIFSWSDRAWVQLPPMKGVRSAASSVIYKNKVIVTGGRSDAHEQEYSDTMEALTLNDEAKEWLGVLPRLPCKIMAHKCLDYKDRLFLVGGGWGEVVDRIFEIFLTGPYYSKLVHRLPEPVWYHGAERFGNDIYIVGGSTTSKYEGGTNHVVKYHVNTHKCTNMPPLPFAAKGMATVSWQNNVITLGGTNVEGEPLDTVVMYNIESGKSLILPKMKYKRDGCTAVMSNNRIVVMGGADEDYEYLNTVETSVLIATVGKNFLQ